MKFLWWNFREQNRSTNLVFLVGMILIIVITAALYLFSLRLYSTLGDTMANSVNYNVEVTVNEQKESLSEYLNNL